MRILLFGDSITYGDDAQGGWVQLLRTLYAQHPDEKGDIHELYNLGVSGNLTANLVKRMALETEARRWYDEKMAIVIAIGINDTKFKGEDVVSTPDLFKGELEQVLSIARQYSEKIMMVGLTPVDDSLTNPFADSIAGSCYSNERIQLFEKALREFWNENTLPFVEIYEKFAAKQTEQNLLADGLHPNAAGHQFMAELVRPELDKLLD